MCEDRADEAEEEEIFVVRTRRYADIPQKQYARKVNDLTKKAVKKKPAKKKAAPKKAGGDGKAYCVKCRAKVVMEKAKKITMKNGRPATKGVCGKCGTNVFRIGA